MKMTTKWLSTMLLSGLVFIVIMRECTYPATISTSSNMASLAIMLIWIAIYSTVWVLWHRVKVLKADHKRLLQVLDTGQHHHYQNLETKNNG